MELDRTAIGRNKSQDNIIQDAVSCDACDAALCAHGVCSENWCGHDSECEECFTLRELEQDARVNAEFYSHPGWREVFPEVDDEPETDWGQEHVEREVFGGAE